MGVPSWADQATHLLDIKQITKAGYKIITSEDLIWKDMDVARGVVHTKLG
jgi:hypothetical protein